MESSVAVAVIASICAWGPEAQCAGLAQRKIRPSLGSMITIRTPGRVAALLALLSGSAIAQSPSDARIDSIFARFDRRDAPGCAVAVSRAGTPLHLRGYGMADLENDVPITPATSFYLASVSKQFAAYSVILLARDGTLSLDDEVRKFIPELPDFRPRYATPITLRHLLNHTSGLRDYFALLSLSGWPGDGPVTEQDFLQLVGRQRTLNFAPGTRHLYSNTGYVLLSIVVKRASGKPLREFAAERIFAPLGMTSTVVRDDHTMLVKRRAPAYVPTRSGGWELSVPGFDVVGDGGIYSTAEDLVKWHANFLEPRAGDRAALALLEQRGVLMSGDTIPYAAGLSHGRTRGLATVSHGGAYGGYRTMSLRFPQQQLAVAVLCNNGSANASQLAQRVAEAQLGQEMTPITASVAPTAASATPTLSDAQLMRYAGLYWDEQSEARLTIVHTAGKLSVVGFGPPIELRHLGGARFEAPSTGATVTFGDRRMLVASGDARPVSYDAVVPGAPTELAALAGRYDSGEGDAVVEVRVRDGKLELSGRRLQPIVLEHLFGDTFAGGPTVVRFVRAAASVRGLTISNGRSRGVPFERSRQ
jgi:CubicO group peptidase (beta-lactamase class C family)